MMNRPPFPEVIDSSIMAAVRSCGHKGYLEYFEHWKSKEPSVHLHAGAAYAHGLETSRRAFYEEGRTASDAVALGVGALLKFYGNFECPEDSAKSATRMAGALEFYFERYPLETDDAEPIVLPSGKRGIEFSFAEPIDIIHPETGNPILYCGRMDMVVRKGSMVLGEDDKTTSQLGASWPRQWDLRSQFTGYTWGAAKGGIKLDGFLVRGVSILKSKYDTAEAITYRPEWQLDRWYNQLLRDVKNMIRQWEEGYFDYNLDHACAEYGGCPFRSVCLAQQKEPVLEAFFQRRKWDPVTRTETVLEV
jgi:hypothetical protein